MLHYKNPLLLFASPHQNGATRKLVEQVLLPLSFQPEGLETIFLYHMQISPCIACGACRHGPCPFNADGMDEILSKLSGADLVICATPVYFNSVPAPFKAVIDRMQQLFIRRILQREPVFSEKKQGILLTTAGSDDPAATHAIHALFQQVFRCIGADFTGHIAVTGTDRIPDFQVSSSEIQSIALKL